MAIVQTLKKKLGGKELDTTATAAPALKDLPEREQKIVAQVLQKPRVTEKATTLQQERIYTFQVHQDVTKQQVKKAVEKLYNVRVIRVHTVTIPHKRRMRGRLEGWKKGYKKAMVKVKEGQEITVGTLV